MFFCQKHLFLHQLTQNMTKDCSLNYEFSTCCLHQIDLNFSLIRSKQSCVELTYSQCKFAIECWAIFWLNLQVNKWYIWQVLTGKGLLLALFSVERKNNIANLLWLKSVLKNTRNSTIVIIIAKGGPALFHGRWCVFANTIIAQDSLHGDFNVRSLL